MEREGKAASKDGEAENSMSEKPTTDRPRRLSHWINIGQERKVHSLVDKVYSRKNLALAWQAVRRNGGAGGVDRVSLEQYAANLEDNLEKLHEELRVKQYEPQPLRRVYIPKAGKKDQLRPLGIPAVRDRVCQQALTQRLVPIFEPDFDDSSFGYRPGRSPHGAMRKIWREIEAGSMWVVDADLRDFFGSVDHALLMQLVAQRISDGRVLRLIEQMLTAPVAEGARVEATVRGTPQGGVVSPLLANLLLGGDVHHPSGGGEGAGYGAQDTRSSRRDAAPGEDPDRACPTRLRVLGLRDPAGQEGPEIVESSDKIRCKARGALCSAQREGPTAVQGEDSFPEPPPCAGLNGAVDPRHQSRDSRMGHVLSPCPRT